MKRLTTVWCAEQSNCKHHIQIRFWKINITSWYHLLIGNEPFYMYVFTNCSQRVYYIILSLLKMLINNLFLFIFSLYRSSILQHNLLKPLPLIFQENPSNAIFERSSFGKEHPKYLGGNLQLQTSVPLPESLTVKKKTADLMAFVALKWGIFTNDLPTVMTVYWWITIKKNPLD